MGNLYRVAGPSRWTLTAKAAKTAALLSLLFVLVYSSTNWITAQRTDVGTWYFEWERLIPFVPLMIVPYMSIDLFFLAGPFLCRDERELRTLSRRITFAIMTAGIFFLVLPLELALERPQTGGWLGAIWGAFCGLDKPHNLFPSLHITLRTILAELYARHTRGVVNLAVHVWFSLVGFSTVLTHQHHLIDVVGGFILAAFCFYLFSESATRLPVVPNFRVGWYYALGAAAILALVPLAWPWGSLLLWPVAALAIVAGAYWGLGPGIFRKRAGRLPLSTRVVLAPVLIGQYLSLVYYRMQCRAWDEVAPRVLLGRVLRDAEAARAVQQGVTAVLDLTAEFSEGAPFLASNYRNIPILDLTAPTPDQLREAAAFIAEQMACGTVYVHCKIGYSRSAAVVGAYLLASSQAATADEAIGVLRKARPSIVVRPEALEALRSFARSRWLP